MPDRRTYTSQELNQLLTVMRQPLMAHHPALGLLLSMALVMEHLFAFDIPENADDADWMAELSTILQREVLRGTATLLTYGVPVEHEVVH